MKKSNTDIPFPADGRAIYGFTLVCDGTENTIKKLKGLVDEIPLHREPVEIIVTYEIRPLKL